MIIIKQSTPITVKYYSNLVYKLRTSQNWREEAFFKQKKKIYLSPGPRIPERKNVVVMGKVRELAMICLTPQIFICF